MDYRTICDSPLGHLTLSCRDGALTGLWLEDQRYFGAGVQDWTWDDAQPLWPAVHSWLWDYFAGRRPDPQALPLLLRGTAFQQRVWQQLLTIPYGETVSYGALARQLHSSPRAVGGAVGRNPISIVVPCHRVVGSGGALTGYAGGLERKKWLLRHEREDLTRQQ